MAVTRWNRLRPVDVAVLVYNLTITVHILISAGKLPDWSFLLIIHAAIFAGIAWLITNNNSPSLKTWLKTLYPIVLLVWYYPEVGLLRHTVIPQDLDPLLQRWELSIFPGELYTSLPKSLNLWSLEILHASYFSYYLLVFVPLLIAWKMKCKKIGEYLFVGCTSMFIHYWICILFPATGPINLRSETIPSGVLFIPIMNYIYSTAVNQGGAAFPSTHAAAAVIAGWYSAFWFPKLKWFFAMVVILILIATFACTFHYTIDTITGTLTGILALFGLKNLYAYLTR
ncbi:MAG: phosphatase PAP2 family protein [Fidelibacterota bacterium]